MGSPGLEGSGVSPILEQLNPVQGIYCKIRGLRRRRARKNVGGIRRTLSKGRLRRTGDDQEGEQQKPIHVNTPHRGLYAYDSMGRLGSRNISSAELPGGRFHPRALIVSAKVFQGVLQIPLMHQVIYVALVDH